MTSRLLLLSIAPVFATATAYAQAPGDWSSDPNAGKPEYAQPPPNAPVGYYAPPQQPTYVAPPVLQPPPEPGSDRRWSVGLLVGTTELTAKDEYSEQSASFGGGSLAVRFRPWRHLELEFSIGGGSQTIDEDEKNLRSPDGRGGGGTELAMATGTLAARYRFNPGARWNWWLLAGVGATTVARKDATDEELDAARRPHGTLGVGLERRFNRFALQVELRALAVGRTEEEMKLEDSGVMSESSISGGNFTLGASYYF